MRLKPLIPIDLFLILIFIALIYQPDNHDLKQYIWKTI